MTITELPAVVTVSDVQAMYYVCECAWSKCKVAYKPDDVDHIIYGTARHFDHPNDVTDVRLFNLRITTKIGLEMFVPVRELMQAYHVGEFAKYDW